MPIESVASRYARPVRSVQEITNGLLAQDRMGLENGLMMQKADEYRRGVADDAAMRELVRASGGDRGKLRQAIVGKGDAKALDLHDKNQMELDKGQAEVKLKGVQTKEHEAGADIKRAQAFMEKAKAMAGRLGGVTEPRGMVALYADAVRGGLMSEEDAIASINTVPQDPQGFAKWKAAEQRAGMSAVEQMAKDLEERRVAETGRHNKATEAGAEATRAEQARHNRAGEGLTARGQNMARDTALMGGSVQADAQGNLSMVPNKFTPGQPVQASPIMAGGAPMQGAKGAGGQPTEDERKSAGYAIRMEGALAKLDEIGRADPGALRPGVGTSIINSLPEGAANYARSPARQRVETAQLDALDAALTLATGAAYTKEQLASLSRSYFAQPGDDKATVADKEARLKEVVQTARVRAGRAAPTIDQVGNARPAPKGAPAPGTVQDGYRFKGGNAADPKSWEKV